MNRPIYITLAIILLALGCKEAITNKSESTPAAEVKVIKVLSPTEFKDQIENAANVQLVDVRTPEEVAEGTISGSLNMDFKEDDFLEKISGLDREQPVYLFCRSGNRSATASSMLEELGFTTIYDLEGGYEAWKSESETEDN